jgi:hypothetical protein
MAMVACSYQALYQELDNSAIVHLAYSGSGQCATANGNSGNTASKAEKKGVAKPITNPYIKYCSI